jgi:hypothetical protein
MRPIPLVCKKNPATPCSMRVLYRHKLTLNSCSTLWTTCCCVKSHCHIQLQLLGLGGASRVPMQASHFVCVTQETELSMQQYPAYKHNSRPQCITLLRRQCATCGCPLKQRIPCAGIWSSVTSFISWQGEVGELADKSYRSTAWCMLFIP